MVEGGEMMTDTEVTLEAEVAEGVTPGVQ